MDIMSAFETEDFITEADRRRWRLTKLVSNALGDIEEAKQLLEEGNLGLENNILAIVETRRRLNDLLSLAFKADAAIVDKYVEVKLED